MKARDIMTTTLITIGPEARTADAARLMLDHRISGLPVVDAAGTLIGVVSEGDLLRREEAGTERTRSRWLEFLTSNSVLAAEYVKAHARTVRDVMTASVIAVGEDATLAEIADLLETRRIKRLPVVRDGKPVGIVSRSNLLQAVATRATAADDGTATATSDFEIRNQIVAEINRHRWGVANPSNVVVAEGIVHLWGEVLSDAEQQAVRIVAENTPGVREVVDHLSRAVRVPAIG